MGGPRALELVSFDGAAGDEVLRWLGGELEYRFGAAARVAEGLRVRSSWFDEVRGQYPSACFVDSLIDRADHQGVAEMASVWTLGITDVDLFAPGLEFVFGEATLGGCCAVVSTARLRPENYGEAPDRRRFLRRLLVEAVHELGHVAGLDHCTVPRCVMSPSRIIEDSDRKGPDFCPACANAAGLPLS